MSAAPVTVGLMSNNQFQRGCAEVNQFVARSDENRLSEQKIQQGIRNVVRQVGELQIDTAQKIKADVTAERNHELLVRSVGFMILDVLKRSPAPSQNPTQKPGDRAKQIADNALKMFEKQNIPRFAVYSEEKQCMTLTPGIALTILDILKILPNCNAPDLRQFKDQIEPQALKTILANRQITKVVFATIVKGTPADKAADEVKATRPLEVTYV